MTLRAERLAGACVVGARVRAALAVALAAGTLSGVVQGQVARAPAPVDLGSMHGEQAVPVSPVRVGVQHAVRHGLPWRDVHGWSDDCARVNNYSNYPFDQSGGSFIMEAGMAQTEMAAASYQLTAADFPIQIDTCEVVWATSNASEQVTEQWSVLIWSGIPSTGTLVDTESSDGVILNPVVLGPGTTGLQLVFSVDPGDPDQIIVNDDGSHILSVAFRIDHHNSQTQNPCFSAPPTCCNAFMCVDNNGLQNSANNWLYGVNCGSFGCPPNGGWARFSQLSAGLCRPSGDWVLRATWHSVNCQAGVGACCHADGTCAQDLQTNCTGAGMTYFDGSQCASVTCPTPTGACCSGSGGCVSTTAATCTNLGGVWLGAGVACGSGGVCPTGACCLADGSCSVTTSSGCTGGGGTFRGVGVTCAGANCQPPTGACCTGSGCGILTQSDCTAFGGAWHGAGSNCAASCPPPTGACCTSGGGCGLLTQSDCTSFGGTWAGAGTTCASGVCSPGCYANCDSSTSQPKLNVADFTCFLQKFGQGDSYANCDGSTSPPTLNVADFTCFLQKYAQGCP